MIHDFENRGGYPHKALPNSQLGRVSQDKRNLCYHKRGEQRELDQTMRFVLLAKYRSQ